jgi:hypothetical protein
MKKPKPDSPAAQAQALSIPERILASDTDWEHAGADRERRRTT